jgi:hypothetical protein
MSPRRRWPLLLAPLPLLLRKERMNSSMERESIVSTTSCAGSDEAGEEPTALSPTRSLRFVRWDVSLGSSRMLSSHTGVPALLSSVTSSGSSTASESEPPSDTNRDERFLATFSTVLILQKHSGRSTSDSNKAGDTKTNLRAHSPFN